MTDANTLADIFLAMGQRLSQAEAERDNYKWSLGQEENEHKKTKERLQTVTASHVRADTKIQSLENSLAINNKAYQQLKEVSEKLKKRLKKAK